MEFNNKLTEITTGVTDFILAIFIIFVIIQLYKEVRLDRWKVSLWCFVLGFISIAALFGAVVHTFELSTATRQLFWKPINFSLGLAVALTGLGGVYDFWGARTAIKLLPIAVGLGAGFFLLTLFLDKGFIVFMVYQVLVMVGVLIIYTTLAFRKQLAGAGIISLAVVVNIVAALVQQSSLSLVVIVPFDHNGLFHIIQMVAIGLLGWGVIIAVKKKLPIQNIKGQY
ncbi:hypothetical protein H0A36_15340 [Endozoicomonas sp. SM1973]|uniref:Uncharacterized protein n=1 Tax=Spartinivicinus marinus TaxID=2994442 RepID=A0A853I090_9GAMM|nr:hypothetical protein [Spartinivicinus marinus]MCX4026196.1 hypothetical protein [Spartinivicinus marinus]NYZ67390.1 hypothetical protein [Spartinivicinus marinus]